MMVEAITLIETQLNQYIAQVDGGGPGAPDQVVIGNVAQIDRQEVAADLDNHLILGLVNLQEEATLKNGNTASTTASGAVAYRNVPIHLNLYLLFSANYRNYGTALKRLAQVIQFFQGKQKFTIGNSPGAFPAASAITDFQLVIDLVSLRFEEVNHLWGFLGAKAMPFVLYRARLIAITDDRVLEGGGRVRDLALTMRGITA